MYSVVSCVLYYALNFARLEILESLKNYHFNYSFNFCFANDYHKSLFEKNAYPFGDRKLSYWCLKFGVRIGYALIILIASMSFLASKS